MQKQFVSAVVRMPEKEPLTPEPSNIQLLNMVKGWMPDIYLLHISQDHVRQERDYIEEFSNQVKKETQYPRLFYYVLPHDDNEKGINLFVKSMNCDMIALATRKRNCATSRVAGIGFSCR